MADYYVEDCKAVLAELKEEDKRLRLKRRWLMDLPLSENEHKRVKELNPLADKRLPESMLREDDMYFDKIKNFVERNFGAETPVKECGLFPEKLFETHDCVNNLLSLLDDMTNTGLYAFSLLVTEGSLEFEKTKWKMKKIIKKYLQPYLDGKHYDLQTRKDQISSLFNNQQYFCGNYEGLCSRTDSFRAAAIKVLDMLKEFPTQTLAAMHRKLKGKKESIPKLEHRKLPRKRDLVPVVRRRCMNLLSKLDEGKEPPESLINALSIASLTAKLILCHTNVPEFRKFSPKVEAVQQDIAKAIRHISAEKIVSINTLEELCKKWYHFPGPGLEFSSRSIRFTIRSILIEYLFECSDMEIVPESLTELLNGINKRSDSSSLRSTSKKQDKEEVECLLCFSAQVRQIIWEIFPDQEVDQDFAKAYMENSDDSDDDYSKIEVHASQHSKRDSCNLLYRLEESVGETKPDSFDSLIQTWKAYDSSLLCSNSRSNLKQESLDNNEGSSSRFEDFAATCPEFTFSTKPSGSCNRQLLVSLEEPNAAEIDQIELTTKWSGSSSKYGHRIGKESEVEKKGTLRGHLENGSKLSCCQNGQFSNIHQKQCACGNNYLSIQRASDETAMAMYHVINRLLNEFVQVQHLG